LVGADARNQELNKLISNLAFDVGSAIHEYVGIVLSNSVYPDAFPVSHDHEFDLSSRELRLTVTVPPPSGVPSCRDDACRPGRPRHPGQVAQPCGANRAGLVA
jgi:restriction system protein